MNDGVAVDRDVNPKVTTNREQGAGDALDRFIMLCERNHLIEEIKRFHNAIDATAGKLPGTDEYKTALDELVKVFKSLQVNSNVE